MRYPPHPAQTRVRPQPPTPRLRQPLPHIPDESAEQDTRFTEVTEVAAVTEEYQVPPRDVAATGCSWHICPCVYLMGKHSRVASYVS